MKILNLYYVCNDGCNRPVYENDGKLFVDTDPRKDNKPKICTVLNDVLGAEPDIPIEVMKKYENTEVVFFPKRITW